MVDEASRQGRQQEQTERQTRICDALRDFYRHGLKDLRAKGGRRDGREGNLFKDGNSQKG